MRFLSYGSMNIDHYYELPYIVKEGETISATSLYETYGGKGLNQSIALVRAGADVWHAGCVGEDGQELKEYLQQNGVDTSCLTNVEGKNGQAHIQLAADGANSIILYTGSNFAITPQMVDEVFEQFDADTALVLQNEVSCLAYMVEKAAQKGFTICLNPSPVGPQIAEVDFSKVNILMVNELEAEQLTGESLPEKALPAMLAKWPDVRIVMTLGKDGAIYADKNQTMKQPIIPIEVVNTTGAGDTFTGYFLYTLLSGGTPQDALLTATKASALKVSRAGTATSIPTMDEVEKI